MPDAVDVMPRAITRDLVWRPDRNLRFTPSQLPGGVVGLSTGSGKSKLAACYHAGMRKEFKRLTALSLSIFTGSAILSLLGLRAENADILAALTAAEKAHADVPHVTGGIGDSVGCNIGDYAAGCNTGTPGVSGADSAAGSTAGSSSSSDGCSTM